MKHCLKSLFPSLFCLAALQMAVAQSPVIPDVKELRRPFGKQDREMFRNPRRIYRPEIWVNCLAGNLSREGIEADLQAISEAGFAGVQFFFGDQGSGTWPGVERPIKAFTPEWEEFLHHTATEARRLGLRFTLQNCPGWAMAGGPWIKPENAMRHLVYTEKQVNGSGLRRDTLEASSLREVDWRDYRDEMVIAFPTPAGSRSPLVPKQWTASIPDAPWLQCLTGDHLFHLPPTPAESPHWVDITLEYAEVVRTLQLSSVQGFNHWFCYEPGVHVRLLALYPDGSSHVLVDTDMPASNWMDVSPISLSCTEQPATDRFRLEIVNRNQMGLSRAHLMTAALKDNWETEAAWTLRNLLYKDTPAEQPLECYIPEGARDLTEAMHGDGIVEWDCPGGEWTLMRIGHVNTGKKNAPAPPEATGWECDKLSTAGAEAHFDGYIGRLQQGAVSGLLDGMLLDSWECEWQTWTAQMAAEFRSLTGYDIHRFIPALFGYVVENPETTARFLRDWRSVINRLVVDRFYRRMAELGHARGLSVNYETAPGDVFNADVMEYFKYADVPMCEFWVHSPDIFVGSFNFKPIRPTASAARLYGKPRVGCEAFTSLQLTWDETLRLLKETANKNRIHGATHFAFQAYTHNPLPDKLIPGSSFGAGIGTPFLRNQTWWAYMPHFTAYTARTTYMLERGLPVSDFLWYLGDEIDHKPDQMAAFPEGFKYDYCNPDVLLTRLSVEDGHIVTPEGIRYRAMWLPQTRRMLPETLEKLVQMVQDGATIIGNAPQGMATLSGGKEAENRFRQAVQTLWGGTPTVGMGRVLNGITLDEAIRQMDLQPDVLAGELQWLHRRTANADWYYVCAPSGGTFAGEADFSQTGAVELWDPVTGDIRIPQTQSKDGRTRVSLDLARGESAFVVFRKGKRQSSSERYEAVDSFSVANNRWQMEFPDGWDVEPRQLTVTELKPWKDLPLNEAGRAFSGTVKYRTTFDWQAKKGCRAELDLGRVESIAKVTLNGKPVRTLWTPPYRADLTKTLKKGRNELEIEVTHTWFNRLVHDANQPESARRTWTLHGPAANAPLRESGLIGPVLLRTEKRTR